MLCTQYQLRSQGQEITEVSLLPCRSWGCEYCNPNRQKQLKAIAASGMPNICLTLTVNASEGESQEARYKALHNSWKILAKRIIRQFRKPAGERWQITTEEGYPYVETRSYAITSNTKPDKNMRLHYMAFAEETKKGEPHLHILLRMPFIPQKWLSLQMDELLKSPIVWIEQIKGVKGAIAYVTKYVTKAPAQFGRSKRYWMSRFYQINKSPKQEIPIMSRQNSQLVKQSFTELFDEIIKNGLIPIPLTNSRLRLLQPRYAWKLFSQDGQWSIHPDLSKATIWLETWRRRLANTCDASI
jgi:hypothetical protein